MQNVILDLSGKTQADALASLAANLSGAVAPKRIILSRDIGRHLRGAFSMVVCDDRNRLWRYNEEDHELIMIFDPSAIGH